MTNAEPPMDHSRTPSAAASIDTDLTCHRCGYNLRGLRAAGHCPECDAEVGRSATPELLRYSDVEWMRRTARGAHLLAILVIARIAVGNTILTVLQTEVVAALIAVVLAALWAMAVWECTRRDPGHRPAPDVERARLGARVLLIGTSVLEIALAAREPASVVESMFALTPGAADLARWTFDTLDLIAGLLGFFLILTWALALAARIPDAELATSTRKTRKGITVCLGLMAVLVAPWRLLMFMTTLPAPAVRIGNSIFHALEVGATIGLLVFTVLAIILLFKYRAALVQAATESSEYWA